MLFTTLEFSFTVKIRSFTFVSCMISTVIPRCFQTVVKILFPLTLITLSFETSIYPLGNPRIFDCRPSPGEGNLNRK